jgi:hypothetical protein
MRRFRKKPQFNMIVLPKDGCIKDDRVLEGDRYAKYKYLLDELPKLPVEEPVSVAVGSPSSAPAVAYHTLEAEKDVALVQKLQGKQKVPNKASLDDALDFAEDSAPVRRKPTRSSARKKKEVSL